MSMYQSVIKDVNNDNDRKDNNDSGDRSRFNRLIDQLVKERKKSKRGGMITIQEIFTSLKVI
jgi:hypothetical protein